MSFYVEPVYLNEKMVLNCAAYLFQGVSLETEVQNSEGNSKSGSINLGFKFLQDLLSPIGAGVERKSDSSMSTKTARRYTLGGLHMCLLDELNKKNRIKKYNFEQLNLRSEEYIELDVILKPVDFYSILEVLKVSSPLIFKVLHTFGDKINPKVFNDKIKKEIKNYEDLALKIIGNS